MNAIQALAVAKSYTDSEIAGAGAIKGAPCQIQSITDITGGHRVTFLWVDNEEVSHTSTLDVMDGDKGDTGAKGADGSDGVGITSITFKETDASGNNIYTITMTDGDTYEITCPKGAKGNDGQNGADGVGVPSGGNTGQVLAKKSATDYDTEWKDVPQSTDTNCTLLAAGWSGNSAPYTQTVNVSGIISTDKPILDVAVSDVVATGIAEVEDWAKVTKATSGTGNITFSCYEEKPTNDLTVNVKVVR